ncbi:uncharacterized protein phf11 isoform X2 [Silurus meridionalis]|uniref:uncharacterized protein phf11 isoform X2 n=1 Tax=Silurus meridionalis TaxID=175797 RepID=UPI001EEA0AAA|nr:uncharacterized protein phf11 isoform X2 [Silurus meridionalis]
MHPEDQSSSSDLCCVLCKRADETKITGPLSCKQSTAAHQNCLLYASGLFCKNSPPFDDLFGFDLEDVENECKRGKRLKCSKCGKHGATAGCEVKSCKRSYHYPCAKKARAVTMEDQSKGTFTLYCEKHNPNASIVGPEQIDAKALSSSSGSKSSETSDQDNNHRGSESESETPRRSLGKRKHREYSSDSDEAPVLLDLIHAPIESEFEDITPPPQNLRTTFQFADGRNNKKPKQDVAFNPSDDDDEPYQDSDLESPSLLHPVYRHENVPFKVIEASIESVAENSSGPCSPAAQSLEKPISALEQAAAHPLLNGTSPGATSESSIVNRAFCRDMSERCASVDIPPVHMTTELPQSSVRHSQDLPIDLTAPGGSSMAQVQTDEPIIHVGVSDLSAALFWRRCNDVGCTEDIFADLTRQLTSLAEKVKNAHATKEDYAVSLRILEASGKLPEIFKRMEQDLEDQERQLLKKREALRDAKAVLRKNQSI